MSFRHNLENIRIIAYNQICSVAKKMFEDTVKEVLINHAEHGMSTGKINMSGLLDSSWFTDLKELFNFGYSSDALLWLIKNTINDNPLFDGITMKLPLNCDFNVNVGIINFEWYISKDNSDSITHNLNDILKDNKILIINKNKDEFNNELRECMKSVASKGRSEGEYSYYGNQDLARILSITDNRELIKWLLDKIVKENEDLVGINFHIHARYNKIVFKW